MARVGVLVFIFRLYMFSTTGYSSKHKSLIESISCYGTGSKGTLVFLHGMEDPSRRGAFLKDELILKKIADELNVKVALPRSGLTCNSSSKVCWNMFTSLTSVEKLLKDIQSRSGRCFRVDQKTIYIGFSNGGYFLNKVSQHCLLKHDDRIISIGSAGSVIKNSHNEKACSGLHLMVSSEERTYPETLRFYLALQKIKRRVGLSVHTGYHRIPYPELKNLLQIMLKTSG